VSKPLVHRMELEQSPSNGQVDFGSCKYVGLDGEARRVWMFVMVLSWSRAIYVEFIKAADLATFMRCHINAFEHFGVVPRKCLYDNAKVVVLGRTEQLMRGR